MITSGQTRAGLEGAVRGIHNENDDFYMALYTSSANLDKNTAAYTAQNEVKGAGYEAGGMLLSKPKYVWDGDVLVMDFDDPIWNNSSITASGGLIYNRSKGGRSLFVASFGREVTSINGNFRALLPPPTAKDGLIRAVLRG